MRKLFAGAAIAALFVASACTDKKGDGGMPTAPRRSTLSKSVTLGTCTTLPSLTALAQQVFGAGSPNLNSVVGKLNNLDKMIQKGDIGSAQAQAQNIVSFVQQKAATGKLPGTAAQINAFIGGVLCYAGLAPDTFLIQPTDQPQVLTNSQGNSGVSLQGNTVTVPTLLTITLLDPNGPSGINTKLDQYPTFITITTSSTLTKPAIVAICLGTSVPVSVFNRLRLGHQALAGFEITPVADPSFLGCPTSLASASRVPGWLKSLASLVLPKVLYARQEAFTSGGVGGSATEFSPFDAVDDGLFAAGGVGGSATEFQRKPLVTPIVPDATKPNGKVLESVKPGAGTTPAVKPLSPGRSNTVSGGVCTSVDATVGTALDPLCRPVMTITTAKGTILTNVPVSWSVASGGGTIAPETIADNACGTFGATAATATDVSGKAGVCWTLGPNGGSNTTIATPSAGGDAPPGVTFIPASTTFTATGLKITPTATATGTTVTFDGLQHPGSGTCSNGLTPVLTYSGDGSVPQNTGTYTLTVTCGAGSAVYNTATATATISIGQLTPVVTVSCPVSVVFNGSAQTPCTASVTGAGGLSQAPTPSYASNTNVGTATASYTFAATGNYGTASGSANFGITAAPTTTTVTCSVTTTVYTGSAQTPCSATVTGPGGLSLTPTPSYLGNTDVGAATASYTYAAGGNYLGSADSKSFSITQATSATAVSCPASVVYTGTAQTPCTASVTGAGGLSQSVTPLTYGSNTSFGTANASATFAGDANHSGSTGSATFSITTAPSSTAVICSPTSVVFSGNPQTPCSASVTGAGGLSQPVTVTYANNVSVGTATASATFAGDANHAGSSGSTSFTIAGSPTSTTVSCPTSGVYTGSPLTPCTAMVTGPGGLSQSLSPVTYLSNTNVGTASATASFTGGGNYQPSGGSASFSITPAASVTSVVCSPSSVVYSATPQTPCSASVTGAGGLSQSLPPSYATNTNVGTATASANFGGDANHTGSAASATFQITLAASGMTVSCPASVPYSGAIQNPCTATASGVGLSQAVPVVYTPATVRDGGAYTASATFSGDANHSGSSGAGGFSVTRLPATATAGSGVMSLRGSLPALPCALVGVLPSDAGSVLCTTTVPGTLAPGDNVTTPNVSPSNPVDYAVMKVNGTLTVRYVQSGCFASPIASTMPPTTSTSNPKKGSNVTVKCRLVDATGRPVITATGNLLVQDMGTNGQGSPVTVFSGNNVFKVSDDGDRDFDADDGFYTYVLGTSPTGFVSGHFYLVTATWNDGSNTTGWIYLR